MTNVKQIPEPQRKMSEAYLTAQLADLKQYVSTDLRRRFDNIGSDAIEGINIIDQAKALGLNTLADEMINDYCTDDEFKYYWKLHEGAVKRELQEGADPSDRFIKAYGGVEL